MDGAAARKPSREPAERDTFALVEVVSPLAGTAICSIRARSVPELKARIEEATGIRPCDQCLILDHCELKDGCAIAPAPGHTPVVVGLLHRAPIIGVVGSAIEKLYDDDSSNFTGILAALDEELADLCTQEGRDMEQAASLLVEEVLLEPDLAMAECCAAIARTLRNRYAKEFYREFLNACQHEFETILVAGIGAAEHVQTKTRMLAMAMFIGYLFVWKVLPMTVVAEVIRDFIGSADEGAWRGVKSPEPHLVECASELLDIAGFDLDGTPDGRSLLTRALSRLSDLMARSDPVSGASVYSEALKEKVRMVIELRSRDWN